MVNSAEPNVQLMLLDEATVTSAFCVLRTTLYKLSFSFRSILGILPVGRANRGRIGAVMMSDMAVLPFGADMVADEEEFWGREAVALRTY
jgi:hypothetical protein